MKRILVIGTLLPIGIAIVVVALGWRVIVEAPPASEAALSPVEFTVAEGEGLATIAPRLEAEGLVVSGRRFRWLARLRGEDRGIHAGTYRLARGADPRLLLVNLVEGRVRLKRLTIPEGWRVKRIAQEAETALGVSAERFAAAAASRERLERMGSRVSTLEGYLYPDTYFFPDGVSAGGVVDALLARFEEVIADVQGPMPQGFDRHDLVTLASIVEAETPLADEKPRVAAVYLNRIRDGWLLQADPTVRYGIARFTGRLYYKHLDIDTPYNTYLHRGLPPGPIASPGQAAMQAVLTPLEPCEDFYFVASGKGGHIFSRTKAEHDRAIRSVRTRER